MQTTTYIVAEQHNNIGFYAKIELSCVINTGKETEISIPQAFKR